MKNGVVINIENISKIYKLGQIGGASLQQELKSWWYKKLGREDPNKKIDEDTKIYGKEFYALKDISLEVKQGDVIGILGKNGAGKSTLLKLISRITAPSEGEIEIWGRVSSMLEVGTGFHQEMTGRENVYLNGAILGMSKDEISKKMDDIISFSEIGNFIDTPVKRYSSGMYVKLAFSVAAHLDSEIMIMDEVLAVGDVNFQNKCIQKMRDEALNSGKTVLYVSHNMDTIRRLCKRCIVLDKGKLIYQGGIEDSIQEYISVKSNMDLFYDFTDIKRESYVEETQKILSMSIEKNVVQSGEDINLTLKCKSLEGYDNIKVRFEFRSTDELRVGAAFSEAYSVATDESYSLNIGLGTKNFAPGRYHTTVIICKTDDAGQDSVLDMVLSAFTFEIEKESAFWSNMFWGNTKFDTMSLTKESLIGNTNV